MLRPDLLKVINKNDQSHKVRDFSVDNSDRLRNNHIDGVNMFIHDVKDRHEIISGVWIIYCPDGRQRKLVSDEPESGKQWNANHPYQRLSNDGKANQLIDNFRGIYQHAAAHAAGRTGDVHGAIRAASEGDQRAHRRNPERAGQRSQG